MKKTKSSKKIVLKITMSMTRTCRDYPPCSPPGSGAPNTCRPVVLIEILKILRALVTISVFFFATSILNPLGGDLLKPSPLGTFEILVGGLFLSICCSAICRQVIDRPQELQAWEMAPNLHHAASSGSSPALRFINIARGMIGRGKWLPVAITRLPLASLLPHRHSLPSILPGG